MTNTTTLKVQYTHLEKLFEPYLTQTNPNTKHQDLTHLRTQSSLLSKYPIQHLIYALIITYSPSPQICNQRLIDNLDPRCLTILRRLHNMPHYTHTKNSHITKYPTHNMTPITMTQAYTHINKKIALKE